MAMGKYHAKQAIFPHGHEAGVFVLLYDVRYRWKALSMGFPSVYSMPLRHGKPPHLKNHLYSTNFNGNEASCGPVGLVAALLRPCASHSRCSVISTRLVGTPAAPQPAFAPSGLHGNVLSEDEPASQRMSRPGKSRTYPLCRRCQAGDADLGVWRETRGLDPERRRVGSCALAWLANAHPHGQCLDWNHPLKEKNNRT